MLLAQNFAGLQYIGDFAQKHLLRCDQEWSANYACPGDIVTAQSAAHSVLVGHMQVCCMLRAWRRHFCLALGVTFDLSP